MAIPKNRKRHYQKTRDEQAIYLCYLFSLRNKTSKTAPFCSRNKGLLVGSSWREANAFSPGQHKVRYKDSIRTAYVFYCIAQSSQSLIRHETLRHYPMHNCVLWLLVVEQLSLVSTNRMSTRRNGDYYTPEVWIAV